ILLSIIYIFVYGYYWRVGLISSNITLINSVGSIAYLLLMFLFFYGTFCFDPSPSYHSVRMAYSSLFGPLFPFIAAAGSIVFPFAIFPLFAILIRLIVRRQNLV
ncbi:hypothetical protein, partial [Roseibium sp. RKSG952]|uniref:hypothetical protein n=1 Tax=Roseibium sp. RKSG952 TaxID=2529384 RepID=UPI001AD910C1